jgi:hypothetical protein
MVLHLLLNGPIATNVKTAETLDVAIERSKVEPISEPINCLNVLQFYTLGRQFCCSKEIRSTAIKVIYI